MEMDKTASHKRGQIDWMITLVPWGSFWPCASCSFCTGAIQRRIEPGALFFGDTFGVYYLVIGLGIFLLSLFIAGSKYGSIVLGEPNEKPKYPFFAWGAMMFTCGLAADILFYSFLSGSCTPPTPTWLKWAKSRSGPECIRSFTGALSPGAFTWCWR